MCGSRTANERGMYKAKNGCLFGIAERDWIKNLTCPKIFITAEDLMGKIVRAVVPANRLIECRLAPVPGIHPVQTPVIFDNRARRDRPDREGREALVTEILDNDENGIVICNGIEANGRVVNYTNMKGVNDLCDNDIYIIMTMLSDDHYAALNTLGQFIGETNIITIYYRDLVSQAIGRNTGYRDSGNGRQAVIIAGANLIRAGYFDTADADSNDPAIIREFMTYLGTEMPWLGRSSGDDTDDRDMEANSSVVCIMADGPFANSSIQVIAQIGG